MSSDDERESFGVNREDLEDIYDQNTAYGRKGRFSKEKAIYGLWADHDSDEEASSSRGRRKGTADYSQPVDFVSGGVKGGSKEEDGSESESEKMDEELVRRLGNDEDMEQEPDSYATAGLPKAFVSSTQQRGKTLGPQKQPGTKHLARKGGQASSGGKPEKAFGSWEKHTKGIGLKLLQKMGYEAGRGLGPDGSGINRPVEVKLRGGRGALAYHGPERTKQSIEDYPAADSEEEKEQEFKKELQQWRVTEGEGKKKPRYKYRTADQVRSSGVKLSGQKVTKKTSETVKVVDMTGPEERVYSSYDHIHSKHSHPDGIPLVDDDVGFLPELLHNVELLAEQAESDILHADRQLQHEQNRIVNLRHERDMLSKTLQKERQELDRVGSIKDMLVQLTERSQPNSADSLSLQECAVTFHRLKTEFPREYISYDLSRLAVPVVFPMIKDAMVGWLPLHSSDTSRLNLFSQWSDLLGSSVNDTCGNVPSEDDMPVFDRLVWEVWMPAFRSAMTSWSPRSPHGLISLLEQWVTLLPRWVFGHLLESWVSHRLQTEVEKWNPTTDSQPIDAWVHPWLPLMGHRLEPLYGPVRHRLSVALSKWGPSDGSAKAIITPWVGVFSQGSMDAFLIRSILPKLAHCLQTRLVINPSHQDLEPFRWVMSWRSLVPLASFADMMDKYFFRQWLNVLTHWLQPASNPNYEEVIGWFSGWKEQFDAELLSHPQIAGHFSHAVEVMQHMVSHPGGSGGMSTDGASAGFPMSGSVPRLDAQPSQSHQHVVAAANTAPLLDFKEIVQRKAREAGLSLLPDRMHDSHMLYRVGRCSIYFSHNVIFCRVNGAFQPVALDQLLAMAA